MHLLAATVAVGTLQGWLQEHIARSPTFDAPSLVAAESSAYVLGGLALAVLRSGKQGFYSCCDPHKYVTFLPASLGFLISGICQYPSIRVFGALQHSLLSQLGLLVTAFLCWLVKGQRQSSQQLLALVQVALGIALLLQLPAQDIPTASANASAETAGKWSLQPGPPAVTGKDFATAAMSLTACLTSGAAASIYLEQALRHTASDSGVHVQMHQLNICQMVVGLLMQARAHGGHPEVGAIGGATRLGPPEVFYVSVAVARGILNTATLQAAGSLLNGAAGVVIMVGVALMQVLVDGRTIGISVLTVQGLLMTSVLAYLQAPPSSESEGEVRKRLCQAAETASKQAEQKAMKS